MIFLSLKIYIGLVIGLCFAPLGKQNPIKLISPNPKWMAGHLKPLPKP